MNAYGGTQRPRRTSATPDHSTFAPDTFWDQPLPDLTKNDGPGNFEARVERTGQYVQNAFFAKEEHAAMAEAVVRLIGRRGDAPPLEHDERESQSRVDLG